MNKVLKLARREYRTSVRTKGFIIGLAVAPILACGSIIAMVIFQDNVDTTDKRIAVVDRSGVVAEALIELAEARNDAAVYDQETGKKIRPAYLIEVVPPDESDPAAQRLALSNRVRARELQAFVEIGSAVLAPSEDWEAARTYYYAENAAIDEVRGWLSNTLNEYLRRLRLTNRGIDEAEAVNVLAWINVEALGLVTRDEATGEVGGAEQSSELETVLTPIVILMFMLLMTMMGTTPLLNAVMEEKTQRIAEVILGSVRPFQFMMGKVLGGVAVSLTALLVYAGLGMIVVNRFGLADRIPLHMLPWFGGYLILLVFMMGSGMAALGSACNDSKDAQNLSFPAILPAIFPMFLLMPILMSPNSAFSTGISLFPPFTPMLMMLRMSTQVGIPAWQPWTGLAGVLALTILTIWVGGRIFRVAILMQGQPVKLGNLIRWALRG